MKRSVVLLLALGACVAPPKAPPPPIVAPRPVPAPVLPAPPPVPWEDRARTPGNWALIGDSAAFATPGGSAIVTLRCAVPEIVMTYPAAQGSSLAIRTTTLSRTLPLSDGQARIAASDTLLDAMIYSRGRFMISVTGQPDLILPPWPEIARVVEDCRR